MLNENKYPITWSIRSSKASIQQSLRSVREQQETDCHLRKFSKIWFSNFPFTYGNIMQRLSSTAALSIQWWRKLFGCFVHLYFHNNMLLKKKTFRKGFRSLGLLQSAAINNHPDCSGTLHRNLNASEGSDANWNPTQTTWNLGLESGILESWLSNLDPIISV